MLFSFIVILLSFLTFGSNSRGRKKLSSLTLFDIIIICYLLFLLLICLFQSGELEIASTTYRLSTRCVWAVKLLITRKPCCRKCSFPLKFANNIQYKYKTSQASKAATPQSSKHAGAKRNLTQNQDSKSIKVTCLESVEKQ